MFASQTHVQQGISHQLPPNHRPSPVQLVTPNIHHSPQRAVPPNVPKPTINVVGIPSVYIENNRLVVGSSQTSSQRSYTPLKVLGDGSFGTVWLCDWHGTLPPNTPLSPMQCGAGARPEWVGKRLVAIKRMKRRWEGGWDECQKLKEIESLRAIPFHPNIIPLYDFFLLPTSKELYFVFESMEGNLYHLIKARKGRPLAGGLVSSIFRQMVAGLEHIHNSGYFHRDMKPENVLVTTTGLFDYPTLSPIAPPNAPPEKDVVTIIKLADFGLARETRSSPPYTEYVSTRWYRAPEVLLLSRDYSNPVDMWALGTIMAELVNLRPLFPGSDQIDQVARICEVLGDPSNEYGVDVSGGLLGGGDWPRGIKLAQAVGFMFRKTRPKDIHDLFERSVPTSLIHCIRDLLRYEPSARLTSFQCISHQYFRETASYSVDARLFHTQPTLSPPQPHRGRQSPLQAVSPRPIQASHSHPVHSPIFPSNIRQHSSSPYNRSPGPMVDVIQEEARHPHSLSIPWEINRSTSAPNDYAMDVSPQEQHGDPMDISSPSDFHSYGESSDQVQSHSNRLPKLALSFGKKNSKWSIFGGDKSQQQPSVNLPSVQEASVASTSTNSLKRTQSSGSGKSMRDISPRPADIKKLNKKEAERMQREAEKQRRALAEKMHREQARMVMQKRNMIIQKTTGKDNLEWRGGSEQQLEYSESTKGKQPAAGRARQNSVHSNGNAISPSTHHTVTAVRFIPPEAPSVPPSSWQDDAERAAKKARVRDYDDNRSVASSDVHSTGRMSSISFATVDSDPGPSRIRNRPSLFGLNRMQSSSSLRTSFDDFPTSVRSSNSFSLDGSISPPPMHTLSLSPSLSPSISPSPHWIQAPQRDSMSSNEQVPPYAGIAHNNGGKSYSPFDFNGHAHPPNPYGQPPTSRSLNKPDINPMFQVVSYKWDVEGGLEPDDISGEFAQPLPNHHPPPSDDDSDDQCLSSPTSLPPFSVLDSVAGGGYDYPPLSPMSFTASDDL